MTEYKKRSGCLIKLGGLFLLAVILYLLKTPLLKGAGYFLIREDPAEQVDALFVLGGSSVHRALGANWHYKQGYTPLIVTLGENVATALLSEGTTKREAECSATMLVRVGVPGEAIDTLAVGTSTREEMGAIRKLCLERNYEKVIILSDYFHTRRIRFAMNQLEEEEHPTQFLIRGCPHSRFKYNAWWQTEDGMLAVNEEYMKLVYYWLKY